MNRCEERIQKLNDASVEEKLARLYGKDAVETQRARYAALLAERSGGAESAESNGAADAKEGESE